jgi:PRTRC genetic system ThiF family protein
MNDVMLDRLEAARLIVPHCTRMDLVLIGCGGTGSWLAPAVARVARLLTEKFTKDARVCFVDPDRVVEKNIYRQNFCRAEVGWNKAVTLAARYGTAWGVDIAGIPQRFSRSVIELTMGGSRYADLAVLIGCVDNRSARRDIQNAVQNHPGAVFWLDCGNVKESGQVLIGRNNPGKEVKNFPVPELCAWLPLPSVQHKELVAGKDDEGEEQHQEEGGLPPPISQGLSCADIAMRDEQGLTINQAMAAVAADYLVRLLLTNNLERFQTFIDLNSGSMQSAYITPANVGKWRRR